MMQRSAASERGGTEDSAGSVDISSLLMEVLALVADVLEDPVVLLDYDCELSSRVPGVRALAMALVDLAITIERDLEAAAAGALVSFVPELSQTPEPGLSQIPETADFHVWTMPHDGPMPTDSTVDRTSHQASRQGPSAPAHPAPAMLRQSLQQARLRISQWLDSRNAPPFAHTDGRGTERLDAYARARVTELVLLLDELDQASGVITPLTRPILQLAVSHVVDEACSRQGPRPVLERLVRLAGRTT